MTSLPPVTPPLITYGDRYLSGLGSEQHPAADEFLNKRVANYTRLVLALRYSAQYFTSCCKAGLMNDFHEL